MTAYADAKAHGYTGTREEFGVLLANAGLNLKAAETAKEVAEAAKQAAETAQQAAASSASSASTSASTATTQAAAAKSSADAAASSATAAKASEAAAGKSAQGAAASESAAKAAQTAAETAKANADTAASNATAKATAAAKSAADAKKTLESIPADYSTLSGNVNENTSGISELKEDLDNVDSEVFISTDNLINPKNILTGVKIHGYNAGQTIDSPYIKDESFVSFGKIEAQKDITYVFVYDLNKQGNINAVADIFNEDGSYSRTAPFSFNNDITLRNSEKYIVSCINIKQYPVLGTEMIIPKGLVFMGYIPHKILLFEKENKELKGKISEQNFELEQVKRRLNNLNKYNELEWKSFDKAYFAFIIDDSTETLYPMYQKFHAKKVPLSSAAIVSNAKKIKVEGVGTNVDVLKLLESDGGEVLAHYYGNLIDIGTSSPNNEHEYLNTKDAWDSRVKDSKKELEQLGFNIRGIMRADYTQEKTATGEKYCMTYYDYSDGLGISKQFSLTRKFMSGLNLSEFKLWIDECISKKGFYPICTHGTEELNVNINEIIDYIISSGGVITTYKDVYDTFKSTKIEEKILSIEKRLN